MLLTPSGAVISRKERKATSDYDRSPEDATILPRWLIPFIALVLLLASCASTEGGDPDTTTTQSTGTPLSTTTADATTTKPEVTTAAPVTIMHIGEGLTQGQEGRSTYRCFLDAMLTDAGVAFDFVGSRQ